MLKIARSLKELSFRDLMEIYLEGNLEKARDQWPNEPESVGLQFAEQDFYQYLKEGFFSVRGAVYAVWEAEGTYASALRLEPYKDGLLLEALETAPKLRRRGYAKALVRAVQNRTGGTKLYSHVHKSNLPSLNLHEKCGFRRSLEYAVYIDGSFNHRCCTLCYEDTLLQRIHSTNDYERELFGAKKAGVNEHLDRWYSEQRPDQVNNNFFVPTGNLTRKDIEAAIALQKARGLHYLLIRTAKPLQPILVKSFTLEEESTYVMALRQNTSHGWKENGNVEIRDIQSSDIQADILDVSPIPEKYREAALRNMHMVLEVARKHPEYHWLCAYIEGRRVGTVYALCHDGCIEMDDLWVEEAVRHQGIATTMMKHIAQTMPGTVYLHASAEGTPRDMYAQMGFEIVETIYEYYAEWE